MTTPQQARQTPKGRQYEHPRTGEKAPSVTTILQGVPKPFLGPWKAKITAQYAVRQRQAWAALRTDDDSLDEEAAIDLIKREADRYTSSRADLGSAVHSAVEHYVAGLPLPEWAPDVAPYMEGFEQFVNDWSPEYEHVEVTAWNREEGYAGTLDAVVRLPVLGRQLLDVKTGKGVYGEAALQMAAYRYAEAIVHDDGHEEPMPEVDGAVVLHLKEGSYDLLPVETGEDVYHAFLYAAEMKHWLDDLSKRVIGQPLHPTSTHGGDQ